MTEIDVAIAGAGISGLSAARALAARGVAVRVFERDQACGGLIRTDTIDDFVIDAGPETLLAHKPAALELVRELGLDARLVAPSPVRNTYVLRRSTLRTLPETSALGLPTGVGTLIGSRAFSMAGKLRMAAEPFIPAAPPEGDESIQSFVRRRFGREAVTYVAEPVLAGIHRGDAARLSMQALFPALVNAERSHGSVARAWRQMPRRGGSGSMSLRGGLGQLVAHLQQGLPPSAIATGREVVAIERQRGFTLHLSGGDQVRARAVLLATPAYATAKLVGGIDAELAHLASTIKYASTVNVALGYRRDDVRHPLRGWGFVVPREERRHVSSASWVSSKWPGRAPEGHALIRVALSASSTGRWLDQPDDSLIDWAHDELVSLLRVTGAPMLTRVYRHIAAMPQLEVGHLDRMRAIDCRLGSIPGLFVSASGFRGIGLPDCISDARAAAARIGEYLQAAPLVG